MTITVAPNLEDRLKAAAVKWGTTPEQLAVESLEFWDNYVSLSAIAGSLDLPFKVEVSLADAKMIHKCLYAVKLRPFSPEECQDIRRRIKDGFEHELARLKTAGSGCDDYSGILRTAVMGAMLDTLALITKESDFRPHLRLE